MKVIAFKRAKHSAQTSDSLHPDFIVEFADTSLFAPNFHKAEDGYEMMYEDKFEKEYAKNEKLHKEFLERKAERHKLLIKIEEDIQSQQQTKDKAMEKEFNEFLEWKKRSKK